MEDEDDEGGELDLHADVLIDEDSPLRLWSAVECLELCDRPEFSGGHQRKSDANRKALSVSVSIPPSDPAIPTPTAPHKAAPVATTARAAATPSASAAAPEKRAASRRAVGDEFWAKLRARAAFFEARAHESERYPVLLSSRLINSLVQAQLQRPTPPPLAPPESQWAAAAFERLDAKFIGDEPAEVEVPEFLGRDSTRWIASLSATRPNEFLLVLLLSMICLSFFK